MDYRKLATISVIVLLLFTVYVEIRLASASDCTNKQHEDRIKQLEVSHEKVKSILDRSITAQLRLIKNLEALIAILQQNRESVKPTLIFNTRIKCQKKRKEFVYFWDRTIQPVTFSNMLPKL